METAAADSTPTLSTSSRAKADTRSAQLLCDLAERRAANNLEQWKSTQALGTPYLSDQLVGTWVLADVATYHSIGEDARVRIQNRIAENSFAYQGYAEALGWIDPALAARAKPTVELIMVADFVVQTANLKPGKIRERIDQAPLPLQQLLSNATTMQSMSDDLHRRLHWLPRLRIDEVFAAIAPPTERDNAAERIRHSHDARSYAHLADEVAQISSVNQIPIDVQALADFIAANKGLMPWKIRENIFNADERLQALLMDKSRMAKISERVMQLLDGISVQHIEDVHAVISDIQDRPATSPDEQEPTSELVFGTTDKNSVADDSRLPTANLAPGAPDARPDIRPSHQDPAPPELRSESGRHVRRQNSGDEKMLAGDELSSDGEPQDCISGDHDEAPTPDLTSAPAPKSGQSQHPLQTEHNGHSGFSPGLPSPHNNIVEPIGDLLERMTYSSRKDGSVMYSIDDRPAFVDHGDQLLMLKDADHDEHAVLGAVLLAKEKYGGAFEITGNREFARRAIEVILKYGVDVRLKNPEQHALYRELANKVQTEKYPAASAEHPVDPINMKARPRASGSPASDNPPRTATQRTLAQRHNDQLRGAEPAISDATALTPPPIKVDRLRGKLLDHGEAPFQNIPDNKMSYFVTLENADGVVKTLWGVDFPRALAAANVSINDSIMLKNLGQKPVEVQQPVRDEGGNIVRRETIMSHRNKWEVFNFSNPDVATSAAGSDNGSETPHIPVDMGKPDCAINAPRSPQGEAPSRSHSPSTIPPNSQSVRTDDPINRLAGTVVSCGSARLHHKAAGPPSYFIELENADGRRHTVWGADLARATENAGVKLGHSVVLQNLGKKTIHVPAAGVDCEGSAGRKDLKRTQRVVWEVENTSQRAPRPRDASDSADQTSKTPSAFRRDVAPLAIGPSRLDAKSHNESGRSIANSPGPIPAAMTRAHRHRPGA